MNLISFLTSNQSRLLFPVIASSGAVGLSIGLIIPLTSVVLEHRGSSVLAIGLNASVFSIAILMAGPFLPALIHRISLLKAMFLGALLSGIFVVALSATDSLWFWFGLRFLLGISGGIHWVSSEAWINSMAPEQSRGRIVGAYATIWSLGIATGPVLLRLIGVDGALPFIISGCIMAGAALPLLAVPNVETTQIETAYRPVLKMIGLAPVAVGAGFVCGYIETATLSLLPVYGLHNGFETSYALMLVSLFAVGSFLFQPLIGWLADKVYYKSLFVLIAAISAVTIPLIPICLHIPFLIGTLLFVWGGSIGGYYTLGMINLGQRFNGGDLTAASSMFVMAYTSGMVVGPVLGSISMQLSDPHGFLIMLALVPIFFIFLILRRQHGNLKANSN